MTSLLRVLLIVLCGTAFGYSHQVPTLFEPLDVKTLKALDGIFEKIGEHGRSAIGPLLVAWCNKQGIRLPHDYPGCIQIDTAKNRIFFMLISSQDRVEIQNAFREARRKAYPTKAEQAGYGDGD